MAVGRRTEAARTADKARAGWGRFLTAGSVHPAVAIALLLTMWQLTVVVPDLRTIFPPSPVTAFSIETRHIQRVGVCLSALVLLLPLLASSAWAQDLRKITFRYSWILYDHAPAYYYAKDLGLWEKEGLDVTILTGKGSGTSVKLMGANQDHFGTADYGTMLKGVVRPLDGSGLPVKGVFGELQIHPMSVAVPARHGVKKPADLAGKSVASPRAEVTRSCRRRS